MIVFELRLANLNKVMRISARAFTLLVLSACVFSVGRADTENETLHGLFCDLTSGNTLYRKTDCLCIDFIDQKSIATFNYRKGKKERQKTYTFKTTGSVLTIDMQGDGGLGYINLFVKSGNIIVSDFVKSRNRAMSFERQSRLPEICW